MTTPCRVRSARMVVPRCWFDVRMKRLNVLLLLQIHARHRLVEQKQRRLHGKRRPSSTRFCQAIGQPAHGRAADVLDLQEVG